MEWTGAAYAWPGLIVVPALQPTKAWAPGSAPTLASPCYVNHGVNYGVAGGGGDGKAYWCGSGLAWEEWSQPDVGTRLG